MIQSNPDKGRVPHGASCRFQIVQRPRRFLHHSSVWFGFSRRYDLPAGVEDVADRDESNPVSTAVSRHPSLFARRRCAPAGTASTWEI